MTIKVYHQKSAMGMRIENLLSSAARCVGKGVNDVQVVRLKGKDIYFNASGNKYRLKDLKNKESVLLQKQTKVTVGGGGGCGGSYKTEKWEDKCEIPQVTPILKGDEVFYSDGKNIVAMARRLNPKVADYHFDQISKCQRAVLDLFQIESSVKKMSFYLVEKPDPEHDYGGNAGASYGSFWFILSPNELESINDRIETEEGPITDPDPACKNRYLNVNTFVHELSHALRYLAYDMHFEKGLWWGLEEGLAVYTEHYIKEAYRPPNPSNIILQGSMSIDETWSMPETIKTLKEIQLKEIKEEAEQIVLKYQVKRSIRDMNEQVGVTYEKILDFNKCTQLHGAAICVGKAVDEKVDMIVYDLAGVFSPTKPTCHPAGIEYPSGAAIITTDGEEKILGSTNSPYFKLNSYPREGFGDGNYYDVGFCFWDLIRQHYGPNVVNAILQSMVEFSKEHQLASAHFPFFETFINITGMGEAEARDYFSKFSVPVDSSWYELGGICWPDENP